MTAPLHPVQLLDRANLKNRELSWCRESSPLGPLTTVFCEEGLLGIFFGHPNLEEQFHRRWPGSRSGKRTSAPAAFTSIFKIYQDSLKGIPAPFPLLLAGTPFQQLIWKTLLIIPPGTTCSYQDLARQAGKPSATRAVANAIGANPIALLIPCHRIIHQNNTLGGYHWGIERKQQILQWETDQCRQNTDRESSSPATAAPCNPVQNPL